MQHHFLTSSLPRWSSVILLILLYHFEPAVQVIEGKTF